MAVAAVLNTALFLAGIWLFFRTYFRDARASLYGLVVMFGSWLQAPHFSNVYKLSVFFSDAGYPSTAALAITLLGLTLGVYLLRDSADHPWLLGLAAFGWAYLYITHPLTAMLAFTAAVLLAATEPGVTLKRRLWVAATVPAGVVLACFWPYYPALGMVVGGDRRSCRARFADEQSDRAAPVLRTGRALPESSASRCLRCRASATSWWFGVT